MTKIRPHVFAATALATILMGALLTATPAWAGGTVIDVGTTTDEALADGDNTNCSIREAFAAANTDTAVDACPAGSGDDFVNLAPFQTYTLDTAGGQLQITEAMTLDGSFASIQQGNAGRVLEIAPGAFTVTIEYLNMSGGNCNCGGAGLLIGANVTANLNQTVLANNNSGTGNGGNIFNNGTLSLVESRVGSIAPGPIILGRGGGIYNLEPGAVTLTRSLVVGNGSIEDGGGIHNDNGDVTLVNSTVTGNVSGEDGGGIWSGGNVGATVSTFYSTITNNRADYSGSGAPAGQGGGLFRSDGTVTLLGTILAGNADESSGQNPQPTDALDCVGTITSGGENLIGVTDNCTFTPGTGDQTGTMASPLDPGLQLLSGNGGPTSTHLPLSNSPAVDGGHATNCPGPSATNLTTDQRNLVRPQNTVCDVGAVELDTSPPTIPELLAPDKRFVKDQTIMLQWIASSDPGGGGTIIYDPARRDSNYKDDGFTEKPLLGGTFSTTQNVTGSSGRTMCFKVLARDGDGNESAFSNEQCTSLPADDRRMTRKGNWTEGTGLEYYKGTFLKSKHEGDALLLKKIEGAKRMVLVATKCPGCGKVQVFMDGDLLKTINLDANAVQHQKLIKLGTFPQVKSGTAKIVVTTQGDLVKIDGLGVSKV